MVSKLTYVPEAYIYLLNATTLLQNIQDNKDAKGTCTLSRFFSIRLPLFLITLVMKHFAMSFSYFKVLSAQFCISIVEHVKNVQTLSWIKYR